MDPHAAGHPGNPRPVETQPQWQSTPAPSHQNQLYNPRAVVPPGLERLVGVEEVILQKKAFFTRSEQTLFTICQESECCGPAFNLRFQDPYKRDVVSLYAESEGDCCGGETHLKITVFPASTIGFINIQNSSRKMSVSIQMAGKPAFTAELPLSRSEKMIEILSANGSCPVATITTEGKKKSSKVVFRFPMDMEATLKTLILAAFLYMKYQLSKLSGSSRSLAYDSGWDTAGGMFFHHNDPHLRGHGGFNGDCGDGGFSGGYCGGVDSGGRGGDSGGGGGDCGGGGGDSGGGGGDSGGGGGDCGGGGGDCGGGGGGCD